MRAHSGESSGSGQVGRAFRFADHPWLSLVAFLFLSVLVLGLVGTFVSRVLGFPAVSRIAGLINATAAHLIVLFLIVPFGLRLPKGKRPFRAYLSDIGLTKARPLGRLLLIALSCYIILALSQAGGSIVYRLREGLPLNAGFLRRVFDISQDLPPASLSPLFSLPSAFEEVGWRGIMLTLFMATCSKRRSILISAGAFALLHLLNLLSGRETVWVVGQVAWAFCMGIFYGYLFVKTGSLIPPMLVHYLGNVFIGSFAGYMQGLAPVGVQALYGVTFSLGVIPVSLMMLWVRFFSRRWPFPHELEGAGPAG
ncbi:MAG: CPBP family intramembrane metalloprotease [Candidatus Krumholzibacteriota bacterium]|nr:CPBP family intramembrane metalloprotease [Candidatus Krumholzibacteriota bacterium]